MSLLHVFIVNEPAAADIYTYCQLLVVHDALPIVDASTAIFCVCGRMVVDVQLVYHHLAFQFFRNFLKRRADHLARTAPIGPEIDEDRRVAVEHIGLETVVADRFGTHNLTPEFPLGFQARQSAAPAQAPWRAN